MSQNALPQQARTHGIARAHWKLAAVAALGLAAAAVIFAFDPAKPGPYPVCLFHALTGLYCPGCGSLRALHQLLHGHFIAAIRFNPLMVLVLPFAAYAMASYALRWAGMRALPGVRICARWGACARMRAWWGWALLAIIVAFGVLRNIPAWPFRLLAP
jgi:hypothetical protein